MKTFLTGLSVAVIVLMASCSSPRVETVTFEGPQFEQKWSVSDLNPDIPADWSAFGFLTFEMNSSTTQRFDLRVFDEQGVRRLTIQPFQGAWVRASIPLVHFQTRNTRGMDMAAIGKTARPGYWIGFSSAVGPITNIDSLGVSMRLPINTPTIQFRNFRLTMAAEDTIFGPYPLVDEFGQWVPAEWTGKAKTIEELKTAWSEEESSIRDDRFRVSKFGGYLDAKVKATGFFRVEKIDGKWWFVDPEGYLFFSTGSCGINSRSEFSRVQGREYIFKEMPPADQLAMPGQQRTQQQGRQSRSSSFYTWNLYRRHGEDWYNKWMDLTARRMGDWGINTIGNWSDANFEKTGRRAYVATLRGWGIETGQMGMPDVYAPDFVDKIDKAAKDQCEPLKNDPYLIGYFIGNELPWPRRELELANLYFNGEPTPMQAELKKFLADGDTPEKRVAFIHGAYARFVSTINAAIKKYDPNHLNLGIRFGGSTPDPVVLASKGFDVFSMNSYGYEVNKNFMNRVYELTGLPIVIGEFHFGAPGRGLAPGLAQVISQEERGAAYSYYVENAATHPALIGTHWFQWIDQPPTGRNDGENYNIGFLDVTDRPYAELIEAARTTFSRLLDIHSGKIPPTDRQAVRQ
ncbi:MAG: hypothetical protein MUE74_08395 [Bacteroidales bacterium]|jgi:hypothetical protein|nr:hypothetical protein [Bacteroidales bacterium]